MRFLLDTNIILDLARHPRGKIFDRNSEVGEEDACTSIVVAELRYGATKKKLRGLLRSSVECASDQHVVLELGHVLLGGSLHLAQVPHSDLFSY